jgi:hypothetical protein
MATSLGALLGRPTGLSLGAKSLKGLLPAKWLVSDPLPLNFADLIYNLEPLDTPFYTRLHSPTGLPKTGNSYPPWRKSVSNIPTIPNDDYRTSKTPTNVEDYFKLVDAVGLPRYKRMDAVVFAAEILARNASDPPRYTIRAPDGTSYTVGPFQEDIMMPFGEPGDYLLLSEGGQVWTETKSSFERNYMITD